MPVSLLELRSSHITSMRLEGPALELALVDQAARLFPLRHLSQVVMHGSATPWLAVLAELALKGVSVVLFEAGALRLVMCPPAPRRPALGETLAHWDVEADDALQDWAHDQAGHLLSRYAPHARRVLHGAALAHEPAWLGSRLRAVVRAGLVQRGLPPDTVLLARVADALVPLLLLELYPADRHSLRDQAQWCWRHDLVGRVNRWCERLALARLYEK